MKKTWILFKHILKLTLKRKGNYVTLILLPLIGVLAALAFNTGGTAITNIGVHTLSDSNYAKDFINDLNNNGSFKVFNVNNNYKDSLSTSQLDCVIEIPNNFEQLLVSGELDKLMIYSTKNETATIWIQNYINYYFDNLKSLSKVADSKAEFSTLYNNFRENKTKITESFVSDKTQSKSVTKSSIGFLLVFMLMAAKASSNYIINDKRRKTYTRIFSATVSKFQYLIANVLVNMLSFAVQLSIILFLSLVVFKLNFYTSLLSLIVIFTTFGLVAISFGVIIAAFSKSTNQASQLANILIVPTSMLAGCFWPSELMPAYLQKLGLLLPQTWVLKAVDIFQHGGKLVDTLPQITILLGFAAILITISIIKMRKDDDVVSLI